MGMVTSMSRPSSPAAEEAATDDGGDEAAAAGGGLRRWLGRWHLGPLGRLPWRRLPSAGWLLVGHGVGPSATGISTLRKLLPPSG